MSADTEARRIVEACLAVYYEKRLPAVAAGIPSEMRWAAGPAAALAFVEKTFRRKADTARHRRTRRR
jgi:hypothetical protein